MIFRDTQTNRTFLLYIDTKFGRCALFEPSAIANCASVKLGRWSWVCQIRQKKIKWKCALSSSTRVLRSTYNLTVARTTRV